MRGARLVALAVVASVILAGAGPASATADATGTQPPAQGASAPVTRIAGADRYATSAAISRVAFPNPDAASKVFLVAGTSFSDGLSAGPAAAVSQGAVLMTRTSDLPAAAAGEIRRLTPDEIVIVGGTGVVSAAVEKQARNLAPTVTRVAGLDRYATSRLMVDRFFPAKEQTVYLATGRDFPDALAGGALAARQGAPVLLMDGRRSSPDAPSVQTLKKLDADRVTAFGGTGVVTQNLLQSAAAVTQAGATRLGGATRYETSARIAAAATGSGEVLLATGTHFPDALSAIQLAAARNAPIVLTVPYCIATATAPALKTATRLTLIGGPGAVRGLVGSRHACLSVTAPASAWVLVNKKNPLNPKSYAPSGLRSVAGTSQRMRADAAAALERLIAGAKSAGVGRIVPASGYRSYATQQYLYDRAVSRLGKAKADIDTARPGYSEHQTGWAVDVTACSASSCSGIYRFGDTAQGRWTARNAHRFGFIVRYEPGYTSTTGYRSEPWHLRYVGAALATDYKSGGFHTLEGYLGRPPAPKY